ncbi:MAG TPA: hypothetical protein VF796_09580, partial [Humisphaera sp.]
HHGLAFAGTAGQLGAMIRDGRPAAGDLFLDYDVKGNVLSRPGLDALIAEARRDRRVTHALIPRADRLVRPDDVTDGIALETLIRRDVGLTILFMNRVAPAMRKGQKLEIGEFITTAVEYERAGQERKDLAQKIIAAQVALARSGRSAGGRAPYGLRRCLVRDDGSVVRLLEDGEHVRTKGQHVVWVPGPDAEFNTRLRILELLMEMPATQVARRLTAEGVPAPDAGRTRTDGGVRHATSGVWHATTVAAIARHPINQAIVPYGRRSMGDRLRLGPDGPRELTEADYRPDDAPKVVRNPDAQVVTGRASFGPLIDPDRHRELMRVMDARAGTQRGKPRSRTPERNPLGSRVYDMDCSWPMYRQPHNGSFRYVCGLYYQSHAQRCAHNTLDGPTAVRFLLSCVRQRLLRPDLLAKLERRLRAMAEAEAAADRPARELGAARTALADVDRQLPVVARNMALASTEAQRQATAAVFEELTARRATLAAEVAAAERAGPPARDAAAEADAAMAVAYRLTDLAADPENLPAAAELFRRVNARLFVRFREVPQGKRRLRKPLGGVVTFGDAPPPIDLYAGTTTRQKIKEAAASGAAASGDSSSPGLLFPKSPGSEGDSLGNVSRGDKI